MSPSPIQIAVVVILILLLFGASRLGDIGKGLGEGIKNFKKGINGDDDEPTSEDSKQLESKKRVKSSKKSAVTEEDEA